MLEVCSRSSKKNRRTKRVTKIITKPTRVNCRSFNDFVERYSQTITHYMVNKEDSPTLTLKEGEEPVQLIDEKELTEVKFVSDKEEAMKNTPGNISIYNNNSNRWSLIDGANVTIGVTSFTRTMLESQDEIDGEEDKKEKFAKGLAKLLKNLYKDK